MTVTAGVSPEEAQSDREFRDRRVESATGAHLANAAAVGDCELFILAGSGQNVDFVARKGPHPTAIEVKRAAPLKPIRARQLGRQELR